MLTCSHESEPGEWVNGWPAAGGILARMERHFTGWDSLTTRRTRDY
jgi:hypothetical protein